MNTTRPGQASILGTLAASLTLGLAIAACDRRALEDDTVPTPPADTSAGAPAGAAPTVSAGNTPDGSASAGSTSQADALALLIVMDEHEIAAADQALMKKVSGPVLAYAQMMKDDHAKNLAATTRLGGAASTASAVSGLHDQGEADLEALAAVQDGAAYEKAYVDATVRNHAEALALIDDTVLPAANADNVRRHFTATRATVARHLKQAKALQDTLK
jgi:putative membrane protein